jgi:hypothetical protein
MYNRFRQEHFPIHHFAKPRRVLYFGEQSQQGMNARRPRGNGPMQEELTDREQRLMRGLRRRPKTPVAPTTRPAGTRSPRPDAADRAGTPRTKRRRPPRGKRARRTASTVRTSAPTTRPTSSNSCCRSSATSERAVAHSRLGPRSSTSCSSWATGSSRRDLSGFSRPARRAGFSRPARRAVRKNDKNRR